MDILSQILDLIEIEYPAATQDRAKLERIIRTNFGGDRHYIASTAALDRQERDAEVQRLVAEGLNSEVIAARLGLTGQRVRQIRAANAMP